MTINNRVYLSSPEIFISSSSKPNDSSVTSTVARALTAPNRACCSNDAPVEKRASNCCRPVRNRRYTAVPPRRPGDTPSGHRRRPFPQHAVNGFCTSGQLRAQVLDGGRKEAVPGQFRLDLAASVQHRRVVAAAEMGADLLE